MPQPHDDLIAAYQWRERPQRPQRPTWFDAWPGGARLAVMIVVLHEWESVPRPLRPMPAGAHHTFDFLALGAREYAMRFGVYRVLDVLERHGVPATAMCSGLACELFPETIAAIRERGHELGTHGWDQAVHPPVFASREEENAALSRAIDALERLSGRKTAGYLSQGPRPTPHTLELCAAHGIRWTADYADSDIPYVIDVAGAKIVSVGYTMPGYHDHELAALGFAAASAQLLEAFDVVYAESARRPMKFCYAVHSDITGRPVMSSVLDRLLAHARALPEVWFCRAGELADFWLAPGDFGT